MKFYILLLSLFLIIITSCAKIDDNITTTSRSLIFRTNKVGILQTSSDVISWEYNDLGKKSLELFIGKIKEKILELVLDDFLS